MHVKHASNFAGCRILILIQEKSFSFASNFTSFKCQLRKDGVVHFHPMSFTSVESPARMREGMKRLESLESMQRRKRQRPEATAHFPEFLKSLSGCSQQNGVSLARFL